MKALVLGADGTIGAALMQSLQRTGHEVIGTSRRVVANRADILRLDFEELDPEWLALPQVDVAFFCAGMTKFSDCRADPRRARRINVDAPTMLARRLVQEGARVVLLSTSAVFDWSTPRSPADRPLCPVTVYGSLKADAETQFAEFGRAASILRLSKVLTPDYSLMRGWIDALAVGRKVTAFSDLHMAPIPLEEVLAALHTIAEGRAGGIFQLSASRDISYLDAALHIADRLRAPRELVSVAQAGTAGIPPEEVMRYSSLDMSRLSSVSGQKAIDPIAVIDSVFHSQLNVSL
jgi:dTDP-4-dehydrorhamnose reductase